MIFLPIAERELRVAARKHSTFWLRVIAAMVATVFGCGFLILNMAAGIATATLGGALLKLLAWLSFAAALSAGLFFTSDSLSEEKREGTLGFLFLTDLRGYDVVFGKLVATSLRCLYALLAIFPILAVTQIMGAVSPGQFWKTVLTLVHVLLLSLAAGLFVSAISRDSQKALAGTFCLLLILSGSGPALDGLAAAWHWRTPAAYWSLVSPVYLFTLTASLGPAPFWTGLLIGQAITWLLFIVACALIPRTWQDQPKKTTLSKSSWAYWWKFGSMQHRASLRRRLIGRNPVLWLACRERWQATVIWLVAIAAVSLFGVFRWLGAAGVAWQVWSYIGSLFSLLAYLWLASQSSRFLVEARRSGLIELLLAAPLSVKQIVQGQWGALLRMFGVPVLVFLGVNLLGTFLAQDAIWGTIRTTVPGGQGPPVWTGMALAAMSVVVTIGNLIALIWFGMWMGLTSKTNHWATLKTIAFVQIIPVFVIGFASMLIMMLVLLPKMMSLLPALTKGAGAAPPPAFLSQMVLLPLLSTGVGMVLNLAKDIGFVLWSRRKLYSEFRERAAQNVVPIRVVTPPRLASTMPAPPVIVGEA